MANAVKYFTSAMGGAPVVSNNWGDLTAMLDACLVTGFALRTVTGITRVGTVATAAINGGNPYQVGQEILIAGAGQAAYNGEKTVTSITAGSVTFDVTGTPSTPATTLTALSAKVAPLGFEIAFTGANKRAYRSPNVLSKRPYLRVDDSLDPVWTTTYSKYAKVTMAEGMSDIDAFVGARAPFDPFFPTKNEVGTGAGSAAINGWHKWIYSQPATGLGLNDAGVGGRTWVLVGDDRGFFLSLGRAPGATVRSTYCFNDFESYKASDGFPTLMGATEAYEPASGGGASQASYNTNFEYTAQYEGKSLMRDFTQLGVPVRAGFFTLNPSNTQLVSGRVGPVPWPNGPDFSLQLYPVWVREEAGHVRGLLPGVFFIPQVLPFSDLTVVENVSGYPGRKFLLINGAYGTDSGQANSTRIAFDITGPWR